MSDRDDVSLTADQRRARDAVRALGTPVADPAFRARLGAEFAAGTVRGGRLVALPRRRVPVWAAIAAAAATVLLALGLLNRGPAWSVTAVRGTGMATIGEQRVRIDDTAELSRLLARGGRVRLPDDATIDLIAPGQMAVRFTGGTDALLPPAPNRWFAREVAARVSTGEMFITTGRAFHGARLRVRTPEAGVLVTGTSLAVLRESEGTCVCVMEGRVGVSDAGRAMVQVPAGRRCICPADGEQSVIAPILDYSMGELHSMNAGAGALLGR